MIIRYKTKVDINGNIYDLVIDTDTRQFARMQSLSGRADAITITRKDRRRIIDGLKGYTEVDCI